MLPAVGMNAGQPTAGTPCCLRLERMRPLPRSLPMRTGTGTGLAG
ncbi:hypothetical protein BZL30_4075 [Mycobacterium kansasii]|uniref:Uncharacterized protein n=1 Tax=Mycobacterium kansasii TaxID=1768 RepID=A0A1V3X9Z5_MYCKA|nr:hypothetical protein BZL30_4075 [Mycobacterium kansasii]